MRKLVLYVCQSLDGYIAGPNHELDWLPPLHEASYNEFISSIDVILMGRKTYEVIRAFTSWPYTQQCIVFTSNPEQYTDSRVTFTNKAPAEVLKSLRVQAGKNIWLEGGSELIKIFYEADLIDEYIVAIAPVVIGKGIPLFAKSDTIREMKLINCRKLNDDLVELHYVKK